MIYIFLNLAATFLFLFFTFYIDKKISIESSEPSIFSVSMLMGVVESGLFTLILMFKNMWLGSLIYPIMLLIYCLDGLIFINISFGFLSLGLDTKKFSLKVFKYALNIICVIIIFTKFKTFEITPENGIVIGAPSLFSEPLRSFFPWTWVSLFTFTFKFVLPIFCLLLVSVVQEKTAPQIQKYQTLISAESIGAMWIFHFFIKFISESNPSFSLLLTFPTIVMFVIIIQALKKTSVPSGKGIFVTLLRDLISYILPAIVIAFISSYIQPSASLIKSPYFIAYILISIFLISFSLWISDVMSTSSKFYTAEYENVLEQDLASIDYQDAEMDFIINKMNEIIKKNVEASSLSIFILNKQNELEVAYSSAGITTSVPVNNPIFDTLLGNNKNVVIYQQIEKEHSVSAVSKELDDFFTLTKSDALFILNEGHNIFGLITLGKKASGDHYKDYDYNVFTKLYSYFFVFGYFMRNISNKEIISVVNREIKMSSQIITSIQENIDHIKNPKVDTGYLMVPSHNIGGEFIDLIRLTDTRHLFVVGDLSGKGIAASMNMVILKSIIRTYLTETHDFKELVVKVNTFVRDSLRKGTIFAGLFALIDFETDTMYYINCGIPALMMYTQVYNNVIEIQGSGHVLGFVKDISPYISVKTTKLNRGDIILACTDGLINSHSLRGEQFGKERVQQALLDNSTYPAQRMAQFTFDGLLKFMSKEMEDDVSILVLKYESSVEYYKEDEKTDESDSSTESSSDENNQNESTDEPEQNIADETIVNAVTDAIADTVASELEIPAVFEEQSDLPPEDISSLNNTPPVDDMPLPEGVDMPDLSGLDDLLKDAGL